MQTENQIQRAFVTEMRKLESIDGRLGLFFHIPNGNSQRHRRLDMHALGCRAGVADIFLPVPTATRHGLFIEFKTKDGRQSSSQKDFQAEVESLGYQYTISRSCHHAVNVVFKYLDINP